MEPDEVIEQANRIADLMPVTYGIIVMLAVMLFTTWLFGVGPFAPDRKWGWRRRNRPEGEE